MAIRCDAEYNLTDRYTRFPPMCGARRQLSLAGFRETHRCRSVVHLGQLWVPWPPDTVAHDGYPVKHFAEARNIRERVTVWANEWSPGHSGGED